MKKKTTKPKRNYSRTIDLFLVLIYVIVAIYCFIILQQVNFLPTLYHYLYLAIAFLLFYYFFSSSLKKYHKGFRYIKRFILIMMIVSLIGVSSILQTFKTSFDALSQTSNQMYLITHFNQDDISQIGIQVGSDEKKTLSLKDQLMNDYDASFYEATNYDELFSAFDEGLIDALFISNAHYLKYQSLDPTFSSKYRVLSQYQYKIDQVSELPDVFTIYLSGIDTMGSPDQLTRSDTNVLLIVDSIRNRMTMVSIPRDAYLPNTALDYANDKFTHTALYGIETSMDTLENFFQIPIDYYARISFQSLISIVDGLDGIDVDVEIDFCEQDENRSFASEDMICLNKGKQTLNGKEALAYARHRKTANYDNAGRERAQKRIIKAMIEKATSPSILLHINDLLSEMSTYLMTNVSTQAITSFVSNELNDISKWEITSLSNNVGVYDYQLCASNDISLGTSSVYLYDEKEVKAIQDTYYGATQDISFASYSFDINTFNSLDSLSSDTIGNILWSSMAQFPH